MTVSTTAYTTTVSGNGATTVFNFSFIADNANTIQVIYTDVNGVQTVLTPNQYTLVINTPPVGGLWGIGGTVTYPLSGSPVVSGTTLTIQRVVPYTQTVSIANQGAFYPQAVEQGLDLLELQIQQFQGEFVNTVRAPVVDGTLDMTLPAIAARANKFLFFDINGLPIGVVGVPGTTPIGVGTRLFFLSAYTTLALADAAASAAGGALVIDESFALTGNTTLITKTVYFAGGILTRGSFNLTITGTVIAGDTQIFDIAGSGSVTLAGGAKFINVKWFGAKGDNVTDDYTALKNTFTAALGAGGGQTKVYAPNGYYRLSHQLTISDCGLEGASKVGTNFSALQPFTGDSVFLVDDSINGGGVDSRYENFRIYGNNSQVSTNVAGIKLYGNVLYNTFSDIRIEAVRGPGIYLEGKAGPVRPTLNTFINCHVTGGLSDGLLANAGRHMTFIDCAFEGIAGKGINIQGTTESCSKLTFFSPYLENITGDGVYFGAVDQSIMSNPLVNGYGSTGVASYGFRNAGAGASRNKFIGGDLGKNASPNAGSKHFFIDGGDRIILENISAATTDISIAGNRSVMISNLIDGAETVNNIFATNGRAIIATNTTIYLSPSTGAQSVTESNVRALNVGITTLSNLRVESTTLPSGTEQYQILVFKNGAPTSMTCTLTNAGGGVGTDTTNEVFMTTGDTWSIRILTTASAAAIPLDGLHISIGARR